MSLQEWILLLSFLATQIGVSIGIYRHFDSKISGVYKRLDDVKNHINTNFVAKENCSVLHTNTASNLNGVESRMNSRFDKVEKKVEDAFNMIIELLKK